MRFWDASALTPLCFDEGRSSDVDQLVREDPRMTVWWATPVECASAIARRAEIVTLDGRLAAAARLEGLSVLPAAD